jgi:hypothetical protein
VATRFYLPATATITGISPTVDAAWDNTSILARCKTDIAVQSDPMATVSFLDEDASDHDIVFRQYITKPLTPGQTITGSQAIKAQVRVSEVALTNDMLLTLGIRIIAGDGSTVRKTVLAVTRDGTEAATSLTNRQFTATSAATNYTVVSGDRLVIEIGMGGVPSLFGHDSNMRLGDAAASDLPEDDTDTTDLRAWVQLNDTLTQDPETGIAVRAMHYRRMMAG